MLYNQIKTVLPHFHFKGDYQSVDELMSGNVNSTYHLIYREKNGAKNEYILQRINDYVFKEPERVMRNIALVTDHIRENTVKSGVTPDRHVLEIIGTTDGGIMYEQPEVGYWRAYSFITNSIAYDTVPSLEIMREVGRGFGAFQRYLYDFPADQLFVSIPNFHNTVKRFYAFVRSVDEDKAGRAKSVEDEIEYLFEHRRMMGSVVKLLESGELPLRVTHNDTKSNNVMVDLGTHKAICVIDLDTVMPGSSLYDYGDAIRFAASTAAEDEPDTSKVGLDMDKARYFTEGFVTETNGFLTEKELRMLPLGVKVLTCELAMRFLTDYLDGDLYFRVNSPQHNLIRARAQMALLNDVERREEELYRMIDGFLQ